MSLHVWLFEHCILAAWFEWLYNEKYDMSIRYQVAAGSRAVPASRVGSTHSVRQMHGPTGVLVDRA